MSGAGKLSSDAKLMVIVEALGDNAFIPQTSSELASTTGLSKGAVHNKLDELMDRKWVEKHGDRYHLATVIAAIGYKVMTGAQNHIFATAKRYNQLIGKQNAS